MRNHRPRPQVWGSATIFWVRCSESPPGSCSTWFGLGDGIQKWGRPGRLATGQSFCSHALPSGVFSHSRPSCDASHRPSLVVRRSQKSTLLMTPSPRVQATNNPMIADGIAQPPSVGRVAAKAVAKPKPPAPAAKRCLNSFGTYIADDRLELWHRNSRSSQLAKLHHEGRRALATVG